MRRVLITGITGYIGSNLVRALLDNCEVYGLVRHPIHAEYISDIQNQIHFLYFDGSYESMEKALKNANPEIVYHLAACCMRGHGKNETPALISSNIVLGAYLLEAMVACDLKHLVYASTIAAHWENKVYCPQNLYGATKQAFFDLLTYYTDTDLIKAITLVLSDTYGPGDHRPKILNLVKQAAKSGELLELSDGQQDYDLVYIDDVVRAFQQAGELLLQKPEWKNEAFQVCSLAPLSLRETVDRTLAINGLTLNAAWGKRPNGAREIRKAIRLYPTLPGWSSQISLDEGLKKFYEGRL